MVETSKRHIRVKKNKKNKSKFESPVSQQELKKHLDPILYQNLLKIQIDILTHVQVTAAFWDIGEFSNLCKNLNDYPDHINEFLKRYFALAVNIIQKHRGVLDKFIGDGIFAYFGYDGTNGTGNGDPLNAVKASLEFRNKFENLKRYFVRYCKRNNGKDASNISLKCGMDNGMAFLHYYNTERRNSVIIFGSTINYASRLSEFATYDEIIISERMKNMVEHNFDCAEIKIADRKQEGIQSFKDEKLVYNLKTRKRRSWGGKYAQSHDGDNKITRFSIPYKIRIDQPINIRTEFFGSVNFGFLTMCVKDSKDKEAWLGDTRTFDRNTQIGNLFLNSESFESQYVDTVLTGHGLRKGEATATMLMYTDTNDKSKIRPIASKTREIVLI